MALTVDQAQTSGSSGVGFGEFAGVRYRAQGFIPTQTRIDAVGFYFNGGTGSQGLRIELCTISGGIPTSTILASGQLPNASLNPSTETRIPLVYTGLTPGTEYALVVMPWNTTGNVYADDYRDMIHVIANPYAGSYWKYESGTWTAEGIDFKFATYYEASGDVALTPSAQTLTFTQHAPTVGAPQSVTVTPAAQTLAIAPLAPVVGPLASYVLEGFEKQTGRWANSGTGSFTFTAGYNSATAIRLTTPADGDINVYRPLWSAILTGFDTLELDVNFHGNTFLEAGDSPIVIFEQGDWKYARLTNFATNGVNGWQHISIPLAKFTTNGDATPSTSGTGTALNPSQTLTAFRARVYETTSGKQLSLDNFILKDSTGTLVEDFTQATIFSDPHTTPMAVQGGDVMKWSKDDLFSQKSNPQIAQVCARIAALNATHLAYATPYDDPSAYPDGTPTAGYDLRWITAARTAGLKVFHRRQWLTWEGIYSTTKTTAPGLGTAGPVLSGTDTTSYLAKTYQFWLDNIDTLVEAGDIICPCPEPENGGITGVNGSAPYQFADAEVFRTWLRDAITVTNAALEAHGLKGQVFVGGYGTSGFITFGNFDNPHGFLDDRTADAMGVIGMDHYPSPASQMGDDLDKVRDLYELPLMLTEWGTINETTDAARIAAMNDVADAIAARDWVVGLSYWTIIGGANEDVLTADTIAPKGAYYALQEAFGGYTDVSVPVGTIALTLGLLATVASATVTLTPSAHSLALAQATPTISAVRNVAPAPALQTLSAAMRAPTISTTRTVNVSPAVQAAIANQLTPTVTAIRSITQTPTAQGVMLTPLNPTVATSTGITVTPTARAATLSMLSATVQTQRQVAIAAGTQTLSAQQSGPSIGTNSSSAIATQAQTLALTLASPTVSATKSITVATETISLAATSASPAITTQRQATISPAALSLTLTARVVGVTANDGGHDCS